MLDFDTDDDTDDEPLLEGQDDDDDDKGFLVELRKLIKPQRRVPSRLSDAPLANPHRIESCPILGAVRADSYLNRTAKRDNPTVGSGCKTE